MNKNNDKDFMPKQNQKGKLSLAITNTSGGHQVIFSLNDEIGEILKVAEGSDDRNFYKHLKFGEGQPQKVMCISHANDGCYLRILRYIPGRSGDNVEAWIYVPSNLVVTSEQLNEVLSVVEKAILDTKLTEHKPVLEESFNTSYPVRAICPAVNKSAEGKIAYRNFPENGLLDLLGDRLFESYYYDYEKVIFNDSQISKVTDTYEDISDKEFSKWVTVTRGKKNKQVAVYINDTLLPIGGGVMLDGNKAYNIKYTKDFLEPIEKTNQHFNSDTELPNVELDFNYELKADSFIIKDSDTDEDLTGKSVIKIGKAQMSESILVSEVELSEGKVEYTIECEGYENRSGFIKSEVPVEKKIKVSLKHLVGTYKFTIKAEHLRDSADDVKFDLQLKEKPSISPLKNYEMEETSNKYFHLKPKSMITTKNAWIKLAIGTISGLLVGLLIGFFVWANPFGASDASEEEGVPADTVATAELVNQDTITSTKDSIGSKSDTDAKNEASSDSKSDEGSKGSETKK